MNELLMGIKLNQFPLLTIIHVKGAVLGTIRNKKPATHFPSRNSFHYSSWSRDAICYVESVTIMVTSAMESKKCVCHPDCEGKKKLHRRWGSWITASWEHHSSSCVLSTWSFKAFSMSLLVPQTLIYYPLGKETQSLHAVQSTFQYSWWLERASSGGIPVWLFITLPMGYSATLWNHAIKMHCPFHRRVLHRLLICLEPSPLQIKCGQCLLQLLMWHDLKTVIIPVLFRLKSSFCRCLF